MPSSSEQVRESYRRKIESIGLNPEELTSGDYFKVKNRLGWAESTYKTAMMYLSKADKGKKRGLWAGQREYVPTEAECRTVIKEFGAFGTLLVGCGFRMSEYWEMQLQGGYLMLRVKKGGLPLKVPVKDLEPNLRDALYEWMETRDGITQRMITYKWESLQRAGKLSRECNRHAFRHRFITQRIDSGLNIKEVADLVGHSSITTTERYYHSCPTKRAQSYGVHL